MTAHEALSHPFVAEATPEQEADLLPVVKKNFNARRTLHTAIDTIRAINKLREGGAFMDGLMSSDPRPAADGESTIGVGKLPGAQAGADADTPMPDVKRSMATPPTQGLWDAALRSKGALS